MTFFFGCLWALPTSLVGALTALFTLSKPVATQGGAVICRAGGLMCLGLRRGGFAAQTHGAFVFVLEGYETNEALLRHELVHFAQARLWGPLFFPAYGVASLWQLIRGRRAYEDNPFEVQARKVAGR